MPATVRRFAADILSSRGTTMSYCRFAFFRGRAWQLAAVAAVASTLAVDGPAADDAATVGPVLWQPSMNVFRRHAVDAEAVFEFYGDVLGFEQLQTFDVGGTSGVARFQAGASQVKFTSRVAGREYVDGGVRDATGLRLLTFFFPDEAELSERFTARGLPAPEFAGAAEERRRALVADPDGQPVELVVVPGADAGVYEQLEVGLTVSDLETSRAFYRDFVGLDALEPVHDPFFETVKHSFRHGSTIVSLRSFGADLPADTGSGGIQYVVSDVDRVADLAAERGVVVDQPLSELEGFSLRTIWLDDPDGITNYFAETQASRGAQTRSSAAR